MNRSLRRALLSAACASLLATASMGCGSHDLRFAAPPQAMLCGGVSVTFQRAEADDDSLLAKFYITNYSDQVMFVDREGFGLRLPTGQVLQRRGVNKTPYRLAPGQGHEVWVKFAERGLAANQLTVASVIVGGISYANDPIPRIAGEIPLTATSLQ